MPKRMFSGLDGLDKILEGGFLYHNSVLLKGEPGSGKTTLGIQIVYNGVVNYDEPGIIVLFEQFPQQLYRDIASYNWEIERLINDKKLSVIFAKPEEVVTNKQVADSPLISIIQESAAEIGARRILIDSLSHFVHIVNDQIQERDLILRFVNAIKSIGLTPILTAEKESGINTIGFDEYMTDCVIHLSNQATKDKTFPIRFCEVKKTRGHNHIRGKHPYKISERGIEIFPHILAQSDTNIKEKAKVLEKISSGIVGLDDMLFGGYTIGSSTIIAGMPGTYKSTIAAQFLNSAADKNEKGLYISFHEQPDFFINTMLQKGLDISKNIAENKIKFLHLVPKNFYMDELLYNITKEIKENNIRHIVLDDINEFERSIEDESTYKDYLISLLSILNTNGITSLFTQKIDKFTGNAPLTDINYASIFDGIIYIGTIEIESAVKKVISVLKMRGGNYSGDLRKISCGKNGIFVSNKFIGLSGILAGNPQGQYKKTVEEIFQPLYFIRDFIDVACMSETDEYQKKQILDNIKGETHKLVDKLKDYFDIKG